MNLKVKIQCTDWVHINRVQSSSMADRIRT